MPTELMFTFEAKQSDLAILCHDQTLNTSQKRQGTESIDFKKFHKL